MIKNKLELVLRLQTMLAFQRTSSAYNSFPSGSSLLTLSSQAWARNIGKSVSGGRMFDF